MAIRHVKAPTEWTEIKADDGTVRGHYGVRDGVITVRHRDGWEKKTHVRPAAEAAENEGLARLILSEPPPAHWRPSR